LPGSPASSRVQGTLRSAPLSARRSAGGSRHRLARDREAEAVSQISERISTELEKEKLLASYEAQVAQKKKLVDAYTADRAKLVSAGSEKRAQRHTELAGATNEVRSTLRRFTNQRQTFLALQDEVKDLRRNQAPEALRQTQARHTHSGMSDEQWAAFILDYKGEVDDDLIGYRRDARTNVFVGAWPDARTGSPADVAGAVEPPLSQVSDERVGYDPQCVDDGNSRFSRARAASLDRRSCLP